MTTPARFPAGEGDQISVGGLVYKDEEQTRFAVVCSGQVFGLPSFDNHIDALPDCPVKADLLAWRENAFNAFKTGNQSALRGWLQAAWVAWKCELTFDDIHRTLKMGDDYSRSQSSNAQKKRGKLSSDGATMSDIVSRLSTMHPEETAKEIWPHLYSELDQMCLNPSEHYDHDRPDDHAKLVVSYDHNGARKKITFGRFANIISECRQKKSR
jgi:hypothetical protein